MTDRSVIRAQDLIIDRRSKSASNPARVGIRADGAVSIEFPPQGLGLDVIEQQVIEAALEVTGGNITHAAALLHVSRDTLRYRMTKHGLEAKREP